MSSPTRIIWTYWHQGWEEAPSLVRQCRDSWVRLNPDYDVRALDQQTMLDHISFPAGLDLGRRELTVQKVSALARLALLSTYGGVWADATVMCTRPLREWLDEYTTGRFFAFRDPGADRLMSNWFIAAEPDSVILQRLYRDFSAFYVNNRFSNQGTVLGERLVEHFSPGWCADVASTLKWHSWFARKVLRVHPYFIFHYTFNRLILHDPECAELWWGATPLPAMPPHRLQGLQKAPDGVAEAEREITSGAVPMYKLDWRVDISQPYWATVLRRLETA